MKQFDPFSQDSPSQGISGYIFSIQSSHGYVITRVATICPGLNANEIQIPYEKHHKVSSLVKKKIVIKTHIILSSMKVYDSAS